MTFSTEPLRPLLFAHRCDCGVIEHVIKLVFLHILRLKFRMPKLLTLDFCSSSKISFFTAVLFLALAVSRIDAQELNASDAGI